MQTRLLSFVYGFLFLLLIGGAVFRAVWRRLKRRPRRLRKRTARPFQWYLLRLGVTSVAAFVIAMMAADGPAAFLWIVLWAGFYWLWRLWDRWRGKDAPAQDEPISAVVVPPSPPPVVVVPRPLWRRALWKTATLTAGAVAFIVVMFVIMILCLNYYERQAKAERNKVRIGMTADEVLPLVHGACGIRMHAVLPENVSDEAGVHYASLIEHGNGKFGYYDAPDHRDRELIEDKPRS